MQTKFVRDVSLNYLHIYKLVESVGTTYAPARTYPRPTMVTPGWSVPRRPVGTPSCAAWPGSQETGRNSSK